MKTPPFRVGQMAVMIVNALGSTAGEEFPVRKVQGGEVTLATHDAESDCFRFDPVSGRCLNDDNSFGARRSLLLGPVPAGLLVARPAHA